MTLTTKKQQKLPQVQSPQPLNTSKQMLSTQLLFQLQRDNIINNSLGSDSVSQTYTTESGILLLLRFHIMHLLLCLYDNCFGCSLSANACIPCNIKCKNLLATNSIKSRTGVCSAILTPCRLIYWQQQQLARSFGFYLSQTKSKYHQTPPWEI